MSSIDALQKFIGVMKYVDFSVMKHFWPVSSWRIFPSLAHSKSQGLRQFFKGYLLFARGQELTLL